MHRSWLLKKARFTIALFSNEDPWMRLFQCDYDISSFNNTMPNKSTTN